MPLDETRGACCSCARRVGRSRQQAKLFDQLFEDLDDETKQGDPEVAEMRDALTEALVSGA